MRNRPQKIRDIFWELRASLDSSYSSREILELASEILKSRDEQKVDRSHQEIRGPGLFFERDLTSAFSDGGWHVLDYESDRLNKIYDDWDPEVFNGEAPFSGFTIKHSVHGV